MLSLLAACGAQAQAPADPPVRETQPQSETKDEARTNTERDPRKPPGNSKPEGRAPKANEPPTGSAKMVQVTRVVDGDTVEVDYRGSTVDIRLIGVDTPETVHPTEPVECFGPAASRFTTASLMGETVRLEFDVERRDHYGRLLAYVWVDDKLLNSALVRRGFATVSTYPPNVRYVHRFTQVQNQARDAGRGLWERCSVPAPDTVGASAGSGQDNSSTSSCNGYSPCLPPAPDYDCAGGSGDGPEYAEGPIEVTGRDPYELDYDGDGTACE